MDRRLFIQKAQKYFQGNDLKRLDQALTLCTDLYKPIIRYSSKSYFDHVSEIALRLLNLKIGVDPIIATYLFYAVEHSLLSQKMVESLFGVEVKNLVCGVADLKDITCNISVNEQDSYNLRKLLLASTNDIRVLIIRLADRVENTLSLEYLPEDKRERSIFKTKTIYIPLCEYSGMGQWKRYTEDEIFRLTNKISYFDIKSRIADYLKVEEKVLNRLKRDLEKMSSKFTSRYEVSGRMKSIFSIYKKLDKYKVEGFNEDTFDRIQDKFAFRVIVNNVENCYKIFEEIVSRWDVVESYYKLKDYIAFPKPNGYQSIQFVISVDSFPVEIQIRTFEMHEYNEFGPASHIAYKLSGKRIAKASTEYSWTKDLVNWIQEDEEDRFVLKVFKNNIYVLSPKGNLIEIPKDSTPVDYAYKIHTDIGNQCERAIVNGKPVSLDYTLQNADRVEIITNKFKKYPSVEWLDFIVSDLAKSRIHYFLNIKKKEEIKRI